MENEEARGREMENSPFGEQAQQKTETVLRRDGGESLDDYLQNVSAYLDDLNRRLGVKPAQPPAEDPQATEATAPEEVAPRGEAEGGPERELFAQITQAVSGPEAYPPDVYAARDDERDATPYQDGSVPETIAYGAYRGEYGTELPYRYDAAPGDYGTEPPYRYGAAPGDWQSAVSHPELYPDLDDPQVRGRKKKRKKRAEKRAAKKSKKEQRRRRESAPRTFTGNVSRFSFVTTLLNLGLYGGWLVAYFISLGVRSAMFTSAQAEMAMQGVANYSVTISSPVFFVLKLLMYAMPAVLLLWMKGVLSADKKGLEPPDRKWLIAAFAVDLIAGIVVVFDVLAAQLVFGA